MENSINLAGAAAKTDQALPLLQAAARAWNNENEPALDAAMEEIEIFLLDHRSASAAGAGSDQDAFIDWIERDAFNIKRGTMEEHYARDAFTAGAARQAQQSAPSVPVQDERALNEQLRNAVHSIIGPGFQIRLAEFDFMPIVRAALSTSGAQAVVDAKDELYKWELPGTIVPRPQDSPNSVD